MRPLPWLFLLAFFVAACGSGDKPEVLDMAKGKVTKAAAPARDVVVKVTGVSVVFVKQNNRTRFLRVWPHDRSGDVPVPLRDLDDGSGGPMTIDVWPPTGVPSALLPPGPMACPDCYRDRPDYVKCCLLGYPQPGD